MPIVNENATCYYKMVNVALATTEPPITKALSNDELEQIRVTPLSLKHGVTRDAGHGAGE